MIECFSYAKLNNDTKFRSCVGAPYMIIPSGTIVKVYIGAEIIGAGLTEYTLFSDKYSLNVVTKDLADMVDLLEPLPISAFFGLEKSVSSAIGISND